MTYTLDQVTNLLENAGYETTLRDSRNVSMLCPFCPENDPDTEGKCYITPDKLGGIFHCFRCEKAGTIKSLLKYLGIAVAGVEIDTNQLQEKVLRAERNRLSRQEKMPKRLLRVGLPEEYHPLDPSALSMMDRRAVRWLRGRNVSWSQIVEWKIGLCTSGDYAGHLILPVFNRSGKVATFQSRRIIGSIKPKSKNPATSEIEYGREDLLYGIHRVKSRDALVLVEGPWDVLHLQRMFARLKLWRFKGLGLFGHKISRIQAMTIVSLNPSAVWTMMDADAAKESVRMAETLCPLLECQVHAAVLQDGDPDDLSAIRLVKILHRSPNILSFPDFQNLAYREPYNGSKSQNGMGPN